MDLIQRLLNKPTQPDLPAPTDEPLPTPASVDVAEAFKVVRLHGRQGPSLSEMLMQEAHENDKAWPIVLLDEDTGTITVPTTYEGLLAFVARWDSLLLDEELVGLRNLVMNMLPMGVIDQSKVRRARKEQDEEWEHMKEHHPEAFDRMLGGKA